MLDEDNKELPEELPESSNHIDYIYNAVLLNLDSKHPVSKRLIRKIFNYFRDYIFCTLLEEGSVPIKGLGKFYISKKTTEQGYLRTLKYPNDNRPPYQFYPKFSFSLNYRRRLRYELGSNTASELKEIQDKDKFNDNIWETKKRYAEYKQGKDLVEFKRLQRNYKRKRKLIEKKAAITRQKYKL